MKDDFLGKVAGMVVGALVALLAARACNAQEPPTEPVWHNDWKVEQDKKLEAMRERQRINALQQQLDRIESNTSPKPYEQYLPAGVVR